MYCYYVDEPEAIERGDTEIMATSKYVRADATEGDKFRIVRDAKLGSYKILISREIREDKPAAKSPEPINADGSEDEADDGYLHTIQDLKKQIAILAASIADTKPVVRRARGGRGFDAVAARGGRGVRGFDAAAMREEHNSRPRHYGEFASSHAIDDFTARSAAVHGRGGRGGRGGIRGSIRGSIRCSIRGAHGVLRE